MNRKYTQDQLLSIMEQAMISQCACPSLITRLASDLQNLYDYQLVCINKTDVEVHALIAQATIQSYGIIEGCLEKVLTLEGWDMKTLKMPKYLIERQLAELESGVVPSICAVAPPPKKPVLSPSL